MLVLLGCEPSISNDSSSEEIINVLTQNYIDNKKSLSGMLDYYKENGELNLEQGLACSEGNVVADNKEHQIVCTLHDLTRTYRATNHNSNWLFTTYESREDGFVNAFSYLLYTESSEAPPKCKVEDFDKQSNSSICYISLNENWYIEYRYLAIDDSSDAY
jgi:hypothetical protein